MSLMLKVNLNKVTAFFDIVECETNFYWQYQKVDKGVATWIQNWSNYSTKLHTELDTELSIKALAHTLTWWDEAIFSLALRVECFSVIVQEKEDIFSFIVNKRLIMNEVANRQNAQWLDVVLQEFSCDA